MVKVNVTIELFQYMDLNDQAKQKAVQEHWQFLEDVKDDEDEIEELFVIDSILTNEYFFYSSGELASVTHYVGLHPKAGKIILEFNGIDYDISKLLQTHQ